MNRYDMAIVGLGPAGSTLARLLGEAGRLSVCAIDAKALDGSLPSFQKPCGGLLAPDAQKTLSGFLLNLPREILATPQIFSVRAVDLPTGLTRRYQRFYLNMDRHRFDLWLCSLIPASVRQIDRARVTRLERVADGFVLQVRHDGRDEPIFAARVVGADGANSLVRRSLGAPPIRQYLSIQQWFRAGESTPEYLALFDERITDCYAWCDVKDGSRILGAALPKHGCREKFEQLKAVLAARGLLDDAPPLKTEACLVSRLSSPAQLVLGCGDLFLVGEAAGFVSPSSLEGISGAMESARALAAALCCADPQRAYRRGTRALRARLALKLLKCPFLYLPALRRLVMKSGLAAID
ncbi:MAG: FAD-binding protein [Oscillospiraceae bacterium]